MKSRGKRDTTWNILRSITFSPLHFMLYRGKSITFGTVQRTIRQLKVFICWWCWVPFPVVPMCVVVRVGWSWWVWTRRSAPATGWDHALRSGNNSSPYMAIGHVHEKLTKIIMITSITLSLYNYTRYAVPLLKSFVSQKLWRLFNTQKNKVVQRRKGFFLSMLNSSMWLNFDLSAHQKQSCPQKSKMNC